MGGRPIDASPYALPYGQFRCSCGSITIHKEALRRHWERNPACDPRRPRINPRLDLALRLTRLGICPACHLVLGDHVRCWDCLAWICDQDLEGRDIISRRYVVCEECALERQAWRELRWPQRLRRAA